MNDDDPTKKIKDTDFPSDPDLDKTIATNIDDEPTVVATEEHSLKIDLSENIFSPTLSEREDPRKIRSVAGTFKVYVHREGKEAGFVFEGLRKKDYTDAEIKAGYEQYLEEISNMKPGLMEKLKSALANLLNKKD